MSEFFGTPTLGQRLAQYTRENKFETVTKFKEDLCKKFDLTEEAISFNQDYTEVYVRTGGVTHVIRISRNPLEEVEV